MTDRRRWQTETRHICEYLFCAVLKFLYFLDAFKYENKKDECHPNKREGNEYAALRAFGYKYNKNVKARMKNSSNG